MAKPIKNTPVIKGKDAQKFSQEIKKTDEKKPSANDFSKMKENFSKLHSIAHM